MHESHDLELLSALATGVSDDTAEARRLLAECAECAELFGSHVAVLEAVAADPVAPMSDLERQRVRSSIWAEIEPPAATSAGTPWWYRAVGVAAALVVVVGVGIPLTTGGGDDSAPAVDAFDQVAATMSADEQREAAVPPAGGAAESEESSVTIAEAAPEMAADGTDMAVLSVTAAELEETAAEFAARLTKSGETIDPEAAECARNDSDSPGEVRATEPLIVDGVESWMVAFAGEDDPAAVRVYTTGCVLLLPPG